MNVTRRTEPALLFADVQLPTPAGFGHGWLATDATRIHALGLGDAPRTISAGRRHIDGAGRALLPGFVDVHFHGAVGHELMDGDPEGLVAIARFAATRGTTSFLATTWTASREQTAAALGAVQVAMDAPRPPDAARLLGAHMEGPHLNPARAGAQDAAHMRPPDPDELRAHLDTGVVRLMTLAPELAANGPLLDELRDRGITASAGHTDATYADMVAAVARGLAHATHTYNAMRPLHHRDPGCVGACLTLDGLRCELIADNHHVDPVAMDILVRARGAEGVVLVSDAVRPTGLPDGDYRLDHRVVHVKDDTVRLDDGGLAGSVLTLDRALVNLRAATGLGVDVLWPAASANAARSAGADARKGRLGVGLDADLVLLEDDGTVALTVVEGEVAYAARSDDRPAPEEPQPTT
jgi:N-acetylglucosamine-6-phosphate deacetylase